MYCGFAASRRAATVRTNVHCAGAGWPYGRDKEHKSNPSGGARVQPSSLLLLLVVASRLYPASQHPLLHRGTAAVASCTRLSLLRSQKAQPATAAWPSSPPRRTPILGLAAIPVCWGGSSAGRRVRFCSSRISVQVARARILASWDAVHYRTSRAQQASQSAARPCQ